MNLNQEVSRSLVEPTWIQLVTEFLIARGDKISTNANQELLDSIKLLRIRLHYEELTELTIAMHEHDRLGCLDGICDTLYVLIGTAIAMGFGPILDEAFREIARSNMTKDFPDVGSEEKSGKKGLRYVPPDLETLLLREQTKKSR